MYAHLSPVVVRISPHRRRDATFQWLGGCVCTPVGFGGLHRHVTRMSSRRRRPIKQGT